MVALAREPITVFERRIFHGMDNDPQNRINRSVRAQALPPGRGLMVSSDGDVEGVLVGMPSTAATQQQ